MSLSVKITKTSLDCQNRNFILEIKSNEQHIQSYTSSLIFVVTHRLVIVESLPELWFKDRGGKGKWMKLHLQLINEHNYLVKSRNIPLKLSLHYSCGTLVPNQSLLKFNPVNPYIAEAGELIIHFRIEEVSRSHQNQLFMVRVTPDIIQFPLNNDINAIDSSPVRVMSKERSSQKINGQSINEDSICSDNNTLECRSTTLEIPSAPLITPGGGVTSLLFVNHCRCDK